MFKINSNVLWVSMIFIPVMTMEAHSNQVLMQDSKFAFVKGQIMIGGLVAIHDAGGVNNLNCDSLITSFGIQRLEAMRYAVSKVNGDPFFFPNVKLGIEIHDSCGSETKVLDASLQFVIDKVPVCQTMNNSKVHTFGVVGASMSLLTAEVANLLRLFKIPLVSYAATSTELSDKSKYDFLLRTVPPDSFQSDAMVSFIQQELKWKAVHIIYSSGSYGEHGYQSFVSATKKENSLCIVNEKKISPGESVENLRLVMKDFRTSKPNVHGVVCYCEIPDVKTLLQAVNNEGLVDHFRFIGSDTWVSGVKSNGSIIFSLHYNQSDVKDFYDNWYQHLTPDVVNEFENPWFHEFWNSSCELYKQNNNLTSLNCSDFNNNSTFGMCRSDTMDLTCRKDDKIPYTIDAVYSYAYAISAAFKNEFGSDSEYFLKNVNSFNGSYFLNEYLKKVNFTGVSDRVVFHENESVARGFYDINQYNSQGVLEVIGQWKSGKLAVSQNWKDSCRDNFGFSTCQGNCEKHQRRVKKTHDCCWTCNDCKDNEYVTKNKDVCKDCGIAYKPNVNFTGCIDLPIQHIHITWMVIISICAATGMIVTIFTIVTFIRHNETPLVKASGRELTYLLLFGIMMLYFLPFLLVPYPTVILCGIARFCVGFVLCTCYAALLVKTNRIARIFSGRQELLFLTPKWQVILTMMLLMPQILLSTIGLVKDPPDAGIVYMPKRFGLIKCNSDTIDLIGAIAYNLILVAFCTYYAFKTRKVPANFNEARYIGFVMYTTCVVWLAFLPVFFGTSSEYKTIFIMLDLIINATTLLIGLFGIKMYVIILRPDKNSRTNSKCRSVTFFSEVDNSNGTIAIEERHDINYDGTSMRLHHSVTDTTLVQQTAKNCETEINNANSIKKINGITEHILLTPQIKPKNSLHKTLTL